MAYETGLFFNFMAWAIADFDGDGALDIVAQGADSTQVMLGIGDGTFRDRRSVGARASFISGVAFAAGDLNGDGKPDLVAAQSDSGLVSVMLGNGDGTFSAPVTYPGVSTRSYPGVLRSVALGDANGDGHLDIVVTNPDSATVSLLINNGDGTLAPKQDLATGACPAAALVADVNGDGVADIVVANSGATTVSILRGIGNGTFLPKVDVDTGTRPFALAVADLNNDGRLDLVTANQAAPGPYPSNVSYPSSVSVLLQNGDGTLGPKTQFATADGAQSLAIGDFNRDGALDVAVGCSYNYKQAGTISLLRGTGDGGLQHSVQIPCGDVPIGIAAADLDHDGALDLVTISNRTASVFLGNGDGTFGAGGALFATGPAPTSVAIGDINGDGRLDVMTANLDGTPGPPDPFAPPGLMYYTVSELMGDGLGGFGARTDLPLAWSSDTNPFPTPFTDVKLSDFNGDGRLDALVEASLTDSPYGPEEFWASVQILPGHGDGTFAGGHGVFSNAAGGWLGVTAVEDNVHVTTGDVNGDHLPDLVVVFNNHLEEYGYTSQDWGEVWVLLNHGDGTFAAADSSNLVFSRNQYSVALKNQPLFATLGDFNGDGRQDLVVVDLPAQTGSLLLGKGDGTFGAATTFALDATLVGPGSPFPLAVSDLNGDGREDLVAGRQVFLGNGDGTFMAEPALDSTHQPIALAIGDLDGDGIPDVAMADGAIGMVALQLGKGDGTFRTKQIYGVAADALAIGDVNRDGRLDVVTSFSHGNAASVLLNTGAPPATAAPPSTPVAFRLLAPRPNPSRAHVQIEFQLPRAEPVDAQIFDVAGRRTRTLLAGQVLGPGDHLLSWDGRDASGASAAPGLYLVRVGAGGEKRLARIVRMTR